MITYRVRVNRVESGKPSWQFLFVLHLTLLIFRLRTHMKWSDSCFSWFPMVCHRPFVDRSPSAGDAGPPDISKISIRCSRIFRSDGRETFESDPEDPLDVGFIVRENSLSAASFYENCVSYIYEEIMNAAWLSFPSQKSSLRNRTTTHCSTELSGSQLFLRSARKLLLELLQICPDFRIYATFDTQAERCPKNIYSNVDSCRHT